MSDFFCLHPGNDIASPEIVTFGYFQSNSTPVTRAKLDRVTRIRPKLVKSQDFQPKCQKYFFCHNATLHYVIFTCSCVMTQGNDIVPRVIPTGKRPRRSPIAQILLLSHVTTLYQPIRVLASLKSPANNRNFGEFVRFLQKFFPHLKSKAVRTALLKIRDLVRHSRLSRDCHHTLFG